MGVVFILISGVAFGLLPWFARIAYDHGAEPLGMLAVRFLFASVIMLAGRLTLQRKDPWPHRALSIKLFLLGAVGYAPQATFFFFGIERLDISLATVIFYTYPVFVVIASWIFLKHIPTRLMTLCLGAVVLGAALTAGEVKAGSWLGIALMFGAAIWYTGYIVISSKIVKQAGAFTSLTLAMLGAMCAHGVIYIVLRPDLPHDSTGWIAILAASLFATVIAMGFFFAGVSRIGPGESAVLSTVEPVVSIAVGVTALNEELTAVRVMGALLVLGGVALMAQFSRSDTK